MSRISESIFNGTVGIETVVIPLKDVQWVEKETWGYGKNTYKVMMKHDYIHLKHFMGEKFMEAWTTYRYEVEGGKEAFNIMPV